jgi:hypothetical protein
MIRATAVHGEIGLIEFHDAEIESILVGVDGSMRIQFTHLPVYHMKSVEKFEIWSYRAAFEVTGVERLRIEGPPKDVDYVSDTTVTTATGRTLDWRMLLDRQPIAAVSIVFGSGRTVDAKCSHAQLVLQEAVEHVEDWTGPLVAKPPLAR